MRSLLIAIFICKVLTCLSQQNEGELTVIIHNEKETIENRLNAYVNLLSSAYLIAHSDSSVILAQEMEDLATKNSLISYMAKSRAILGEIYSIQNKIIKSNKFLEESIELYASNKNFIEEANQRKVLAENYTRIGDFLNSIKELQSAIQLVEIEQDTLSKMNFLNALGENYAQIRDFELAISSFNKSLVFYQQKENVEKQVLVLVNLGKVYLQLDSLDEAVRIFQKASQKSLAEDFRKGVASAYLGLGNALMRQNQDDLALDYLKGALEIYIEDGRKDETVTTYISMMVLLNKKRRYEKALEKGEIAFGLIEGMDADKLKSQLYLELSRAQEKLGKNTIALDLYKKHVFYSSKLDSSKEVNKRTKLVLQLNKENRVFNDSMRKLEVERKKVDDSKQAEIELLNEKIIIYSLLAVGGLALLFGGFVYNRSRLVRKLKSQINKSEDLSAKNQEET